MRSFIIPFAVWLGVLQAGPASLDDLSTFVATASALAALIVLVYRLGVWRAELQYTKQNIGAELARHREECHVWFGRLERRFATIDQFIAAATEQRVANERWQARVDARLARIERQEQAA